MLIFFFIFFKIFSSVFQNYFLLFITFFFKMLIFFSSFSKFFLLFFTFFLLFFYFFLCNKLYQIVHTWNIFSSNFKKLIFIIQSIFFLLIFELYIHMAYFPSNYTREAQPGCWLFSDIEDFFLKILCKSKIFA